jgi:hypothetical protein
VGVPRVLGGLAPGRGRGLLALVREAIVARRRTDADALRPAREHERARAGEMRVDAEVVELLRARVLRPAEEVAERVPVRDDVRGGPGEAGRALAHGRREREQRGLLPVAPAVVDVDRRAAEHLRVRADRKRRLGVLPHRRRACASR